MYYHNPFFIPMNDFRTDNVKLPKTYKTLDEALDLIKKAIEGEKEDECFYNYLSSIAPTKEEKLIISSIRDDEKKHSKYFKEIYTFYTGKSIAKSINTALEKPKSYIHGIKKAKLGELSAVEKYRNIRAGIPDEYYKDMTFEILTDELKHANKYNYILLLNLKCERINTDWRLPDDSVPKDSFSTEEAAEIAKELGIDFNQKQFDLDQFTFGLNTELEHGKKYLPTDVTEDDPLLTGKIALAHLNEFPDYYIRLAKLEKEAKEYWETKRNFF